MNLADNAAGYFSIVVAETCMPNAIGGILNKKKSTHQLQLFHLVKFNGTTFQYVSRRPES
jgi:hypothetical protein